MTVFVTGSSRGIGKAIAEAFFARGHNVAINCANSPDELAETEREFRRLRENVVAIRADMGEYAQAKAAVDLITRTFGGIDVLVNNAGIPHIALFQETRPQDWNRVIGANILSVLNCSRLVIPQMVNKKAGAVINVSSVWGEKGASCEAVYSMTKGAVNAFTKSIAKELAPSGITANAIACGVFATRMNDCFTSGEREEIIRAIPAGRFGTPAEAAELAVFLASPAASYINGQIINIDGGFA